MPAGADGIVEVTGAGDTPAEGDAPTPAEVDDGATDPGAPLCDPPEQPWATSRAASATNLNGNGDPGARIVNP
jgi:hypothetical protein